MSAVADVEVNIVAPGLFPLKVTVPRNTTFSVLTYLIEKKINENSKHHLTIRMLRCGNYSYEVNSDIVKDGLNRIDNAIVGSLVHNEENKISVFVFFAPPSEHVNPEQREQDLLPRAKKLKF